MKMNSFLLRQLAIGCFAMASSAAFALTQLTPALSLQQMANEADEIVMGNVVGQNTKVIKNAFETEFQVQVYENLKTTRGEMPPGKVISLTLPGGVLHDPPLTQYAMGQPSFYKGQEVALFLKAPAATAAPLQAKNGQPQSTLRSSYKIVGMNQGVFNVITQQGTGEKVVARISLEDYGFINSPEGVKEIEKSIAENKVRTAEGNVVRDADAASSVRVKDPLELTNGDSNQLKLEKSLQTATLAKELRQRDGITVQKLDAFKNQVSTFTNQSK